jgi:hypothetical protein
MGNPILPTGPPESVNVTDITDVELDFQAQAKKVAEGFHESGSWVDFWATFWVSLARALRPVAEIWVTLVDGIVLALAPIVLGLQGEGAAIFDHTVGAIVSDLTGVDTDGAAISTARTNRGRIGAMQETGGALFDLLTSEFMGRNVGALTSRGGTGHAGGVGGLPTGALSPAQGVNAARAFLGFGMSFAVRQGNIAVLSRLTPYGILDQFREYGEMMAKNLGLSRLTRLCLRPLMTILVADPLTWALNSEYRPTLLKPTEAVAAWLGGYINTQQLHDELMFQGYSDTKISAIIQQSLKHPSLAQLRDLHDFGHMNDQDYALWLAREGYNQEVSSLVDDAEDLRTVRHAGIQAVHSLLTRFIDGVIDESVFSSSIQHMGLSKGELDGIRGIAGQVKSVPRKTLSLAQAELAVEEGILDITQFEDLLIRIGYGAEDRTTLMAITLLKFKAKQAKKAAAPPSHTAGTPPSSAP